MTVVYQFDNLEAMAIYYDKLAKDIRLQLPNARPSFRKELTTQATAYEQFAFQLRHTILGKDE